MTLVRVRHWNKPKGRSLPLGAYVLDEGKKVVINQKNK